MTITIIIALCALLLIAYAFDLTASRTRIPSVILLLLLGWAVRQLAKVSSIELPDFSAVLPVLGTVGLILIVLEGSLELQLNRSKLGLVGKSLLGATLPMLALAFGLGLSFHFFGNYGFKDSLTNAIPFCVISSAIAIPSVRNLISSQREFVTYESSLSDIAGVILFNFLALNETINGSAVTAFAVDLLVMVAVSFAATLALSFLLQRIEHHVKYIPIILLTILIYAVSKLFHLPSLIFILIFGLSVGNLDELKGWRWVDRFKPDELDREVNRLRELLAEAAFLTRALFFLLFGYQIRSAEVLNPDSAPWAVGIVVSILALRAIQLKLSKLPTSPLLYVAPRGLITILLFLSIAPTQRISLVNNSLIIQVIVLTVLVMMFGLMRNQDSSTT